MSARKPRSTGAEGKAAKATFDVGAHLTTVAQALVSGIGIAQVSMFATLRTEGAALKAAGIKLTPPSFEVNKATKQVQPTADALAGNALIQAIAKARDAAGEEASVAASWGTIKRYVSGEHGFVAWVNGDSAEFLHPNARAAASGDAGNKSEAGKKVANAIARALAPEVVGAELSGAVGTLLTFADAVAKFAIKPLPEKATAADREAFYAQREAACRAGAAAAKALYKK